MKLNVNDKIIKKAIKKAESSSHRHKVGAVIFKKKTNNFFWKKSQTKV